MNDVDKRPKINRPDGDPSSGHTGPSICQTAAAIRCLQLRRLWLNCLTFYSGYACYFVMPSPCVCYLLSMKINYPTPHPRIPVVSAARDGGKYHFLSGPPRGTCYSSIRRPGAMAILPRLEGRHCLLSVHTSFCILLCAQAPQCYQIYF